MPSWTKLTCFLLPVTTFWRYLKLSYLELCYQTIITAIENIRFEIHLPLILFEFYHTEFLTSHGSYLLNTTLQVHGVGFSVAGLDRAKLFSSKWVNFTKHCILTNVNSLFIPGVAIGQGWNHFQGDLKTSVRSPKNCINSKHLNIKWILRYEIVTAFPSYIREVLRRQCMVLSDDAKVIL